MRTTHRALVLITIFGLVAAGCGGSSDDTTTTTAAPAQTTTTAAEPTTTTTMAETTTTTEAVVAYAVPATSTIGVLQPYSDEGGNLFPAGSVEAHWYQWDGLYVVLYRGYDATSGNEICAGNSILPPVGSWIFVTNSPYLGAAGEICVGAAAILEAPLGVFACDSLLYYLTEIPIDEEGTLFGTLEIGTAAGFNGQTSQAVADPTVPEFEPGQAAYELPPSDVDAGGVVTCDM